MNNLPMRPASITGIRLLTDRVRQALTNATIDLPEYSDPAFRLRNVEQAIELLKVLQTQLATEAALKKMAQPA